MGIPDADPHDPAARRCASNTPIKAFAPLAPAASMTTAVTPAAAVTIQDEITGV